MILVTSPLGFIGRDLVTRLVENGWPVRIYLPDPRHGSLPWPATGTESDGDGGAAVEVAYGSIFDAEALHLAMSGVHTVFHLSTAQWWGSWRDLQEIDVEGTRRVVDAARSQRIGRLNVMSFLGADKASAYTLLRVKGELEEVVINSGIPYTVFRSGIIFGPRDRFINGIAMLLAMSPFVYLMPGDSDALIHPLYIGDLVEGMARSMELIHTVDAVLKVGGPEYLTLEQMVRTIMRVINSPHFLIKLRPYQIRMMARWSQRLLPGSVVSTQWFDLVTANHTADLNNMSHIFNIQPARFEDTLLTYMPGRHYRWEFLKTIFRRGNRRV